MDESQLQRQQAIGRRLRSLRRSRNLTLRALAARLGVKYQTISRWEIGNMGIGEDTLRRVANFFNVRSGWLTSGEGPVQPELGPSSFPVEDLRREWGIDISDLPEVWPEPFKQFITAAVRFGVFPSIADLANMLDRAKELGTIAPLPRELELAVRVAHGADPREDQSWSDRYLAAMDVVFDALEDAGRKLKKE